MNQTKTKQEVISWVKSLLIAALVAVLLRTFLFSPYIVKGESMEPTLHNEEKIFVNKYHSIASLNRGDIVIIKGEKENYVKRVIGFPGDQVEMRNDELIINGKVVNESYLLENRKTANAIGLRLTGDFGPLIVPEGELFVMGDNRLHSQDSRNGLGYIKKSSIIGKSEFVFSPIKNFRDID